jgi:hypothetical protein
LAFATIAAISASSSLVAAACEGVGETLALMVIGDSASAKAKLITRKLTTGFVFTAIPSQPI